MVFFNIYNFRKTDNRIYITCFICLPYCRSICDAFRDLVPFIQFKNMKNAHGKVLLLVKLGCNLVKVALLHGCFSSFLNCTNGTKSCKAPHLEYCPVIFLVDFDCDFIYRVNFRKYCAQLDDITRKENRQNRFTQPNC